MPTRRKKIIIRDFAGGMDLSTGETNLAPNQNIASRNMTYEKDGAVISDGGYGDVGWNPAESGKAIDGLYSMELYPNLLWIAVNGKLKLVDASILPQSTASVYAADTGLSLTAGNKVLMKEYRGMLYFCNGVEVMGRMSVGQLASSVSAGATAWTFNPSETYKFIDGSDKVYCEGDEADYSGWTGDALDSVTNGLAHDAGAYVTQYNAVTPASGGSAKARTFAFFKETMWIAGMPDEPNVLRYSKTVGALGNLVSGYIHDFSDGNNYLIGEGGEITCLLAKGERLYIFQKNKIFYIGIEQNSSGADVFSTDRLFSGVHGCPNAFCAVEMGESVVVFTGKRMVKIGYDPGYDRIIADENFDNPILPILQNCDADQSDAEVFYNEDSKKLRLKVRIGGILQTFVYNDLVNKWSGPYDEDANCYAKNGKYTYFGSTSDDIIYKAGLTFDGDDTPLVRRYVSGRIDGQNRSHKLFICGKIEGTKRQGNKLFVTTYVDNQQFGGPREVNDSHSLLSLEGDPIGSGVAGSGAIGTSPASQRRMPWSYPFSIGRRGKDIRLVFSSSEEGSDWTVKNGEIEYEEYNKDPSKKY